MARGINKAIIVGNLGKDPEVRYSQKGSPVANFTLATSEEWNDKSNGQKVVKTEWHNVVVFGKLAEVVGQYLKKGSQVYIEGKLGTDTWTDQNGVERRTTKIIVDQRGTLQMLGSRRDDNQQAAPNQQQAPQPQQPVQQVSNGAPIQQQAAAAAPVNFASPPPAPQGVDFNDDDVPF